MIQILNVYSDLCAGTHIHERFALESVLSYYLVIYFVVKNTRQNSYCSIEEIMLKYI